MGNFITPQQPLSDNVRYDVIKSPFKPSNNYNFKGDSRDGKRPFRYEWFQQFEWLAYSSKLKGALCKYCVIFRPVVNRGVQGAFIVKPFIKYNDFMASAKAHQSSDWHKQSTIKAHNFMRSIEGKVLPVNEQVSSAERELVETNRKKLFPIISTIIFCGTHDLPLRGTMKGNFEDLLDFRVESGDHLLAEHLTTSNKNAKYTSHQTQNELISICGALIRKDIIEEVNFSDGFSILADESADIAGIEQLSLGVRFVDKTHCVREEFLGFSELTALNAHGIANTILNYCLENNLNLDKLVGLGFDGCSTMAGHENGVQKIIRDKYPKANFFHCASHKLNLVINDLNKIQDIQNTAATIKEIINFFRDSPLRRKYVPNLPLFSETRWSAKYKSIRIFALNFVEITNALETLAFSSDVNVQTRTKSNQLLTCVSASKFIVCLFIMAKYSSKLEPICNILQSKDMDLLSVKRHLDDLLQTFKSHRNDADTYFREIYDKSVDYATKFKLEIKIPRITSRQTHRANYLSNGSEEYYKVSLFIPYIDSIIQSISIRFSDDASIAFLLSEIHPSKLGRELINKKDEITQKYNLDNFAEEIETWVELWQRKTIKENLDFQEILSNEVQFFPSIKKAIAIFLALPPTSVTIERSFSTLRRVKTWLRSSISEDRLSGLCLLSVHRQQVLKNKDAFLNKVLNKFGQDRRRLQFLFSE